jgi:zinc transporter
MDELINDMQHGAGPTDTGSWLVEMCDALTDHTSDFIEDLHDKIIDIEDDLMDQQVPERGQMALLRKQLIVLRRYMSPQRDVFARLASERLPWMNDDERRRMQEIADRLGRGLDDLDANIARTAVLADEIGSLMADALNRRTYTMSMLAMVFLPTTFLTGLFGVNLGGIPGNTSPYGFGIFCLSLLVLVLGVAWWLKKSKWL